MYKQLLFLALFFLSIPLVSHFCKNQTDGFTCLSLTSSLENELMLQEPPLSSEQRREQEIILSQPFHYLARGGQSFVFLSQDGKYVLKFFRDRFAPTWLLELPLPAALENAVLKKKDLRLKKLKRDLSSYLLAFDELKEETGLLFMHIKPEEKRELSVSVIDKLGILHTLDLNRYIFLVQKRATPLYPYIEEKMAQNDLEGAKKALTQMVEIFIQRCKKGIFDEDPRLHKNLGFIAGKAIFIDGGRFKKDLARKRPEIYKQDLLSTTSRLKVWLEQKYPVLGPYLERLMEDVEKSS